jgi:hypothetical protein
LNILEGFYEEPFLPTPCRKVDFREPLGCQGFGKKSEDEVALVLIQGDDTDRARRTSEWISPSRIVLFSNLNCVRNQGIGFNNIVAGSATVVESIGYEFEAGTE